MATTETHRTLLLSTSEGLLLQVGYERRSYSCQFDWIAILRLPPSVDDERIGIPGREVARVRSEDPPHFLDHADDDQRGDACVFIGNAMFSLPHGQAERLRASVVLQPEDAEEAC